MRFHSLLSTESDTAQAADQIVAQAGDLQADLAVLFASHHHGPQYTDLLQTLTQKLNVRNLIGCTGEGIIGPDSEIENQPALVLWLAQLPNVRVLPFLIDQEDLLKFESTDSVIDRLGTRPEDNPSFIILSDPFTLDIVSCLKVMDQAYPNSAKVGGMASGADKPGQNRLFLFDQSLRHGLVGVSLSGGVHIDTVVSQGCRPIGKPLTVTMSQANIIEQLDGQPAYDMLKKMFEDATPEEKALMQSGIFVGVVINDTLKEFRPGDFLVQNLLGVYQESKLAVGNIINKGQTIQFHVRDAFTADQEMRAMLEGKKSGLSSAPLGGLLFSCNGRGRRMFDVANHDIQLVNQNFEDCQIAGFFAQGEIGPVGGQSFVHGFTSSLILFQPE